MNIELKPKVASTNVTPPHNIVNLPKGHFLEYFAKDEEGTLYVVHRPEKNWDYNQFQMYMGPEGNVTEVDVKKVVRYRDGGTTHIDFSVANQPGQLYFPTVFKKELKPSVTLGGKTLTLESLL